MPDVPSKLGMKKAVARKTDIWDDIGISIGETGEASYLGKIEKKNTRFPFNYLS